MALAKPVKTEVLSSRNRTQFRLGKHSDQKMRKGLTLLGIKVMELRLVHLSLESP